MSYKRLFERMVEADIILQFSNGTVYEDNMLNQINRILEIDDTNIIRISPKLVSNSFEDRYSDEDIEISCIKIAIEGLHWWNIKSNINTHST